MAEIVIGRYGQLFNDNGGNAKVFEQAWQDVVNLESKNNEIDMNFVGGDVMSFAALQRMTTDEYYSLLMAKLAHLEQVKARQNEK